MKFEIDDENLQWTLDVKPQRYSDKKYIVYSKDYGLYTKKEAEIICYFLNNGRLLKIIYEAKI